eukprot:m.301337 g.301337  ORF g.301337 m.301337 type:complete len:268 (+) comp19565_c0_seq4:387-1190(+)
MVNPPRYLLLENVKGFEESTARDHFVQMLRSRNYAVQEFLLSPVQFKIPNSRLRYFLVAALTPGQLRCPPTDTVLTAIPDYAAGNEQPDPVATFLDPGCPDAKHTVDEKTVCKFGAIMDLVNPESRSSNCFTKAYAHYAQGTGSALVTNAEFFDRERFGALFDEHIAFQATSRAAQATDEAAAADAAPAKGNVLHSNGTCPLLALGLRYFTPKEMTRLHCYPEDYTFPDSVTDKQARRLVGNSLNVEVVSQLIRYMLGDGAPAEKQR